MKAMLFPYVHALIAFLVLSLSSSCGTGEKQDKATSEPANRPAGVNQRQIILKEPGNNAIYDPGDVIPLKLEFRSDKSLYDSLLLVFKDSLLRSFRVEEAAMTFSMKDPLPGVNSFTLHAYMGDSIAERLSFRIRFTSGIEPENYTYRVIRTFPHDIGAYTQGFEYHEGFIYEGTGNRGESSLRKVDLESGEILKFRNLDAQLFGEGVTIINDKIYQVTYTSQVGFVYDKNSFEELRRIYYQNKEGWGLTNNGSEILMSDGSHLIYFMDTTYFSVQRKIEVYDQNGPVDNLNELELINGRLYANRYTLDEIVIIDPQTGRLTGRIDMAGLLDPSDRHARIDFLNGIAWDKEQKRIFVTGKRWPKVYQVEFIRK